MRKNLAKRISPTRMWVSLNKIVLYKEHIKKKNNIDLVCIISGGTVYLHSPALTNECQWANVP